jgi:60S ribosome subunit biogenesis protein NIP7
MKLASNIGNDNLVAAGTCIGKFTKSGKFHLTIHCLDYLAQYAKYKVWVKPSSEMSFLYGNNIPKSGVGRMTDDTPQYAGVILYNMNDVPLGFGVAAQSTAYVKELDPTANVVLHQCDVGEYLRFEDEMFN